MKSKNDKKRLFEVMQKVNPDFKSTLLNENYPMGAQYDPNAPWNRDDDYDEEEVEEFDAYDRYRDDKYMDDESNVDEANWGNTRSNPRYTHFAVLKNNNKIINGWDYKGYDPEELRSEKRHYFLDDIKDMQVDPKIVKIVTAKFLQKQGIDPFNYDNWNKDNSIFTL